jgi:diguanylate cyclase (GGDEF)-like protein
MRALIVDRDASLRRIIHDVLSDVGCNDVSVAGQDDDVLALAEALPDLDLVVLALELPERPGLELCGTLAARFPSVPILVLSATNDVTSLQAAFAAGARDFIARPLRVGELDARARLALRHRAECLRAIQREERLTSQARRLEQSKGDLERVICVDQLTGVANRRHFDNMLQLEWRRALRAGSALSVVMLDLDYFHALNELYGHLGGDLRLKRVADAMAHCLRRPSDLLARYGGEEFVALLPDTDAAGACVVAERLRLKIEELQLPHEASACHSVVTISAGVATGVASVDRDPETLVAAADAALFRAKNGGRNRYCADATAPSAVIPNRRPWPICPVAVVDPFLVQRIPGFLDTCAGELRVTRLAAEGGDFESVRVMGSKLEETAGGFGIEALAELGTRVVHAAQRTQLEETLDVLDELAWYLTHVQVVYRRPLLHAM